jgi:hypothetical protein
MGYKEAIKIWNDGDKQLMNEFYAKFTYNSNKIENPDTMRSDVERIFKEEEVRKFRVNNIIIKIWKTLMKRRK